MQFKSPLNICVLTRLLLRMAWQLIFTGTHRGGTNSHGRNLYLPPVRLQPSFCSTRFSRLHTNMICKVCKVQACPYIPRNLWILIDSSARFSLAFCSIFGGYSEHCSRVQVMSTVCGLAARKNLRSLLNFLVFESVEQCSLKRVCTMCLPLIRGVLIICNSKFRFCCARFFSTLSNDPPPLQKKCPISKICHVLLPVWSYTCYYAH